MTRRDLLGAALAPVVAPLAAAAVPMPADDGLTHDGRWVLPPVEPARGVPYGRIRWYRSGGPGRLVYLNAGGTVVPWEPGDAGVPIGAATHAAEEGEMVRVDLGYRPQ